MKKILLFATVMVALSSCNFNGQKDGVVAKETPEYKAIEGALMPIAVVNVDTLLNNYKLAQEANERLIKRHEDARLELNQKVRNLQNEMVDFQKKLENNAFLSRERAEQEQTRLVNKEQELSILEQQMSQDLAVDQQNVTMQLRDSISAAISFFNADGRYHMVVSTNSMNDNVLYHAPEYDVTDEVLDILNKRYEK